MYRNPDLAPYLEDDPNKRPEAPAGQPQPNFTQQEWQSVLGLEIYRLIQDDEPLSPAVQDALGRLGVTREQVLGGGLR